MEKRYGWKLHFNRLANEVEPGEWAVGFTATSAPGSTAWILVCGFRRTY